MTFLLKKKKKKKRKVPYDAIFNITGPANEAPGPAEEAQEGQEKKGM